MAACLLLTCCGRVEPARPIRRHSVPVSAAASVPAKPVLKQLKNGDYFVRQPWTVELDGHRWVVPRGYHSNGITAPAALKRTLGDGLEFRETWAAVFHDWLFTQPGVTRAQADKWFYDLLVAYGVSERKATLMFTTVSAYSASKKFR